MKVTVVPVLLIILAVAIGVIPQFTDCESQGRAITTAGGRQIPMMCHWTAQAEIALAVPLALVGTLMTTSRRKESRRNLSFMAVALGIFAILLSTNLIGVCLSKDMICNSVMRPAMVLLGTVTIAVGLVSAYVAARGPESPA